MGMKEERKGRREGGKKGKESCFLKHQSLWTEMNTYLPTRIACYDTMLTILYRCLKMLRERILNVLTTQGQRGSYVLTVNKLYCVN